MTRILSVAAPLAVLLALAACARTEDASLVPQENEQGYNLVGKVGMPEQEDREPAIGEWRASRQDDVEALEFGPMGTDPLFSLLCSGNRNVLLQRHGGAPTGPLPELRVSRGDQEASLPVVVSGTGSVAILRAEVPIDGPVAAAFSAQGELLVVALGDTTALVLPPSPLVADYLRSCAAARPLTAPGAGAGTAPPTGNSAAAMPAANAAQPKQ